MNFNARPVSVNLSNAVYTDLLTGAASSGQAELDVYGVTVLVR